MIILTSIKRLRGEKPNKRKSSTKPNYRKFEVFIDKIVFNAIQSLNHFRTNDSLEEVGIDRYRYLTKYQYVYTSFNKKPGERLHKLSYRNLFTALYESLPHEYETEYKILWSNNNDPVDIRCNSDEEIARTLYTIYTDLLEKDLIDPICVFYTESLTPGQIGLQRHILKDIASKVLIKYGLYNIGFIKHKNLTMDIIFYCKYDELKRVWEK